MLKNFLAGAGLLTAATFAFTPALAAGTCESHYKKCVKARAAYTVATGRPVNPNVATCEVRLRACPSMKIWVTGDGRGVPVK